MVKEITKRILDVSFAFLIISFTLPITLIIILIIIFEEGLPIFYLSKRVGLLGKEFYLIKFRTMIVNADDEGIYLSTLSDKRITNIGRILRETKIDELPQFLNVIKGDLSIVGPRPEVEYYTSRYSDKHKKTLTIKPGVTSPGALYYYFLPKNISTHSLEENYLDSILPNKLDYDLAYVNRYNLYGITEDIRVILLTIEGIIIYIFSHLFKNINFNFLSVLNRFYGI